MAPIITDRCVLVSQISAASLVHQTANQGRVIIGISSSAIINLMSTTKTEKERSKKLNFNQTLLTNYG